MNFAFSEEQEQLREAVRKFMEAKSPSSEVRRLMETTEGYDEAVWKQMAQELGLQSLHLPEAHGGQEQHRQQERAEDTGPERLAV